MNDNQYPFGGYWLFFEEMERLEQKRGLSANRGQTLLSLSTSESGGQSVASTQFRNTRTGNNKPGAFNPLAARKRNQE